MAKGVKEGDNADSVAPVVDSVAPECEVVRVWVELLVCCGASKSKRK